MVSSNVVLGVVLASVCLHCPVVSAFGITDTRQRSLATSMITASTQLHNQNDNEGIDINSNNNNRRQLFKDIFFSLSTAMPIVLSTTTAQPAYALVKGNAPPSTTRPSSGEKLKCTNVDECQALAERREQQLREQQAANAVPIKKTKTGIQYIDEQDGEGTRTVQDGDEVQLYYKVLKLGKRSYDGLSGEGTVVFSRGYGLEDDETKPGDKSFTTVVGNYNNIIALNEGIIGMKLNGIRRFSILPQKGWRKAISSCDGGPGGSSLGGELKTDYVVVPTATMVDQEACFEKNKQPFPITYPEQRRMAQRFDQSLIMEVKVVKIN